MRRSECLFCAGQATVWGKVLAEAEEVAVGVAEDELVHVPLAWGERGEDGGSGSAELGFESGRAAAER